MAANEVFFKAPGRNFIDESATRGQAPRSFSTTMDGREAYKACMDD